MFNFPKDHRLLKKVEFKHALDNQVKVVTPYLVVLGIRSECEHSRMGLIVSRKVGIAVVRNRVKRLLRESFRTIAEIDGRIDFVVIARKSAADASLEGLQSNLQKSLKRLSHKLTASDR